MKKTTILVAPTTLVCHLKIARHAWLWAALAALAAPTFGPQPAQAAVTEAWVHRYNGTNYGYYTAKYAAANGALLWENRHNGGYEAMAMAVDGSGNVVVTGFSDGVKALGSRRL